MNQAYINQFRNLNDRALATARLVRERNVAIATQKLNNTTKDKKDDKSTK